MFLEYGLVVELRIQRRRQSSSSRQERNSISAEYAKIVVYYTVCIEGNVEFIQHRLIVGQAGYVKLCHECEFPPNGGSVTTNSIVTKVSSSSILY